MSDHNHDTKDKILEVARILFANQGFEGTSVREIAKAADVNVASVNYHFSNKENLLAEILSAGHRECTNEFRAYYDRENPSLEDLLVHFFRYFLNKSHDLISIFKMMMSTQHSGLLPGQGPDEFIGPPGGKVIFEAMLKEVGKDIAPEDLYWGMKCLFNHVIHSSLIRNCCFKDKGPFATDADIEQGIRRLCRVVIQELKS